MVQNVTFFSFLLIFLIPLLTFNSNAAEMDSSMPPKENKLKADHAPTPFSAEEIRRGCPEGRKSIFKIEMTGRDVVFMNWEFTKVDEENAVFSSFNTNAQGEKLGEIQTEKVPWKVLQGHASFSAADTTITVVPLTLEGKNYQCWLYEVRGIHEGKEMLNKFWFAQTIPGPPVLTERYIEGTKVMTMTMVK